MRIDRNYILQTLIPKVSGPIAAGYFILVELMSMAIFMGEGVVGQRAGGGGGYYTLTDHIWDQVKWATVLIP